MTTTEPGAVVDMGDRDLMRDPYGGYAQIRERAPLVRAAIPGVEPVWIVTRYEDVKMVLSDPRFVVNPANVPGMRVAGLGDQVMQRNKVPPEFMKYRRPRMDAFDGAEHARLRRLVSQAFTVRRITEHRPKVEAITERLLDRLPALADDGVVDLHRHFAYPLPDTVLCELVGIPEEDRERWHVWYTISSPTIEDDKEKAWRELIAYTQNLVELRRAEPTGDLLSAMIRAQDEDGDRLSDVEMIAMMVMLGLTGPQTNATFIGNGILALLTHPDQLALLRKDPALMPRAVNELLRWCGPTQVVPRMRYAAEDVDIGGTLVRRGEAVWVVLAGANRDPRRFDDPERLDITRSAGPGGSARQREAHVAFGGGAHYCLAAAQARQDAEVAFGALFRRFPGLALAVDPYELDRDPMPFQWRLSSLPVRLGAAAA
jgi:cytochrome P450